MQRKSIFIFLITLILSFTGCGGGGGDGNGDGNVGGESDGGGLLAPIADLSGTWNVTENIEGGLHPPRNI